MPRLVKITLITAFLALALSIAFVNVDWGFQAQGIVKIGKHTMRAGCGFGKITDMPKIEVIIPNGR